MHSAPISAQGGNAREVKSGKPFRDAYKQTAEKIKLDKIDVKELTKDFEMISKECDCERAGLENEIKNFSKVIKEWNTTLDQLESELLN